MKNMTAKEKFLFIFLQIITLGLIWIYWKKQAKKYQVENTLSQEIKVGINVIKLIKAMGGPNNIKEVTNTHTKVKIMYNIRQRVELEEIKNISGISGVFMNDEAVTIIVGNSAASVCKSIIYNTNLEQNNKN
ncbi:hypothetical protein ACJA28_00375 [Mesomycoplasma moatsii]|uniref:hypothetical protein n=1 Tax=Mesomycoplasma moatsii TaxID=171287 RepID=UPI0003B67DBC